MSTSLYWRVIAPPPESTSLYSLKRVLAKRLHADYDGSVGESLGNVGSDLIPFLEGIIAGNDHEMADDAQNLIDAINQHGQVQLIIY